MPRISSRTAVPFVVAASAMLVLCSCSAGAGSGSDTASPREEADLIAGVGSAKDSAGPAPAVAGARAGGACRRHEADVERAVAEADRVFDETRKLPVHARSEALMHISKRLEERASEVAEIICREGGKPLKWAKVEAARAVSTIARYNLIGLSLVAIAFAHGLALAIGLLAPLAGLDTSSPWRVNLWSNPSDAQSM